MENEKNALNDISKAELKARGVSSLATRPNAPSRYGEGGLTAEQLKERFDALSGILAERINKIHAYLKASNLDENISITIGGVPKTLAQFAKDLESGEAAAKYINVYNDDEKKSLQTVITSILQKFSEHVESTSARIDGAVTTINIEPVVDREIIRIKLTALNDKGKVLFSDSVSIANADYLIYQHNESTDAHQDIRGLIQSNEIQIDSLREDIADVRVVAEGRVRARAYSTWNDALLAISSLYTLEDARKEFAIGDQIYIRTPKSTDAWVSGFETRHEPYPGGLGDDLDPFDKWESTEIHVGYLILSPLEAPDVDLTGYVTTDDLNEYSEKVDSTVAETKEYVDKVVNSFDPPSADKVERLAAEVANLTARIAPEYFTTDSSVAYMKEVPAAALPFAEVQEVGGMSYAEGGEIKNAAVTALETVGYNILDLTPALNANLTDNGDGTYTFTKTANGRFSESFPLYIPKGQQVFCYLEIVSTNIDGLTRISLQLFGADKNENGASIGIFNGGAAYAPTADTFFANAYLQANDAVGAYVTFRNPMIKYGKSAEFSPYAKHTYPIPAEVQALEGWGLGVNEAYHNRLDWGKKQYRQEVGTVDMGDLTYSMRVSNGRNIFGTADLRQTIRGFAAGDAPLPAVATGYRAVRVADTWVDGDMAYGSNAEGYTSIEFVNNAYTDAASFKEAMRGRKLVYALAKPIVTDLPDLPDDNFVEVEGGGTVTAVNEYALAAPTKIEYQLKEATA